MKYKQNALFLGFLSLLLSIHVFAEEEPFDIDKSIDKEYRETAKHIGDYGHYCGPDNFSNDKKPVDAVDAACQKHDKCLEKHGHTCSCDLDFIHGLQNAVTNKHVSSDGKAYALAALGVFQFKPCKCSVKIPYWCPTWTDPKKTCHKTCASSGKGGVCSDIPNLFDCH